jgi:hypothetical protein
MKTLRQRGIKKSFTRYYGRKITTYEKGNRLWTSKARAIKEVNIPGKQDMEIKRIS